MSRSLTALVVMIAAVVTPGANLAAGARPSAPASRAAARVAPGDSGAVADPNRPLTLEDCIAIALRQNLTLRIAEADLHRASDLHAASYAKFMPTLTMNASRQRNEGRAVTLDRKSVV